MADISHYIKKNSLKIIAKPNSEETKIIGFDEAKQALKVAVCAPPEENKANIELMKFFSKILGKQVRIKTGLKSKEKLLVF